MNLYSNVTMKHFQQPQNMGELQGDDVAFAKVGSLPQGEVIQLTLQKKDPIQKAAFKAYGSVATIASCSWLTSWLEGKSWQQARNLTVQNIIDELQLPEMRRPAAILVLEALNKALDNDSKRS